MTLSIATCDIIIRHDVMIGQTIKHYKIIEKLGDGRVGPIYKAQDLNLDRIVMLKFLQPEVARDETAKARFLLEAKAASALDHPNIGTFYSMEQTDDGQLFTSFAYHEGVLLSEKIKQGPLPLEQAVDIVNQIGRGLAQVHLKGIIHRNIKPGNVLLTREGSVKILDFGLAKLQAASSALTQAGVVLGTPAYMAPEQLKGGRIDQRTDVWALGILMYLMITGRLPFEADNFVSLTFAIMEDNPTSMLSLRPEATPELERIVEKALAKQPDDRYAEVNDLLADLAAATSRKNPIPVTVRDADTATMAPAVEAPSQPVLGMAYVLFLDIVGYSKLLMDTQARAVEDLSSAVLSTRPYLRASRSDQLVLIPTGDGMALVFFDSPMSPVECAVEIARALKNHKFIKLRMGAHAGPVYRTVDINKARNVAGGGINLAQRVMDCADADHILVSKAIAEILSELSEWRQNLHELGIQQVKHGVTVEIYNLYGPDFGNSQHPQRCVPVAPPPAAGVDKKKRSIFQRLIGGSSTI